MLHSPLHFCALLQNAALHRFYHARLEFEMRLNLIQVHTVSHEIKEALVMLSYCTEKRLTARGKPFRPGKTEKMQGLELP